MSKLFYSLEDYFHAVAWERQGHVSGLISRMLGAVFAVSGDFLSLSAPSRRA
jgi:hypothetical protein